MTWSRKKFADLFRVKHGYAFKSKYFTSEGSFVLLTPGSFNEEGGYRDQGEKTKFYVGDIPDAYVLKKDDLLIAMTEQAPGLLGSSAWIPESNRFLHNQRLGRIVDVDEHVIDLRFLYYLFNTREVRQQIAGSASGTKVRHTAPERIGRVEVDLPPIQTQQTIALIITAYDDMIENNRRRMALLEESARLIYREWFVHLRFPGYDRTRLLDGIPEKWEKKLLGDIVPIKKGKNITKDATNNGSIPVVAGGLNPAYYHDTPNATGPVVTVSASGANAGFVNLYLEDIWASDCSFVSNDQTSHVLYLYLGLQSRQTEIFNMQKGAAQPHVYTKDLARLEMLIPPSHLLDLFKESLTPIFNLVSILKKQNQKLRAARDLLLPRLMSGEIDVHKS